MRQTTAGRAVRFKPLWRIHNSTYRRYAKGWTRKRFRRYLGKLYGLLKLMGFKRPGWLKAPRRAQNGDRR